MRQQAPVADARFRRAQPDAGHQRGAHRPPAVPKTPLCAPPTDHTEGTVPIQIGGSARGYQELFAPSAILATARRTAGWAVYLCIAPLEVNVRFCRIPVHRSVLAGRLGRVSGVESEGDCRGAAGDVEPLVDVLQVFAYGVFREE
jgi:hypothetical protein